MLHPKIILILIKILIPRIKQIMLHQGKQHPAEKSILKWLTSENSCNNRVIGFVGLHNIVISGNNNPEKNITVVQNSKAESLLTVRQFMAKHSNIEATFDSQVSLHLWSFFHLACFSLTLIHDLILPDT